MMEIVSRESLWHPMIVHFPVALLLLSAVTGLILLLPFFKPHRSKLQFLFGVLLLLGTGLLWLAYYTGNMAYTVEVRRICNPPLMKEHLLWSRITSFTFSGASLVFLVWAFMPVRRWLLAISVVVSIVAAGFLSYSGHLGGKLVYEQGAGVRMPPEDCGTSGSSTP